MPDEKQKWIWIDLLIFVRAIYLPLSHQADESFPQFSSYVQINFCHQGARQIYRPSLDRYLQHPFTAEHGVGYRFNSSIGIDAYECIKLLALPPRLRVTDIWRERLIVIRDSRDIQTVRPMISRPREYIDFLRFINSNFAVNVMWKPVPPRNTFFRNLIETLVSTALGFVPGVGPLLSAGFSVAWMAITDPDGFKEWAQNGGLGIIVIELILSDGNSMRKYIDPSWTNRPRKSILNQQQALLTEKSEREEDDSEPPNLEEMAPAPIMLSGLRIMAFSATGDTSEHDGEIHAECLRRAVQCNSMSWSEALALDKGLEAKPKEDPDDSDPEKGEEIAE